MAGRIPQSFINDLLDRTDIVDVIQRRMTLKKTGKNYSGLCPFHDEKTPSFSVSPDKQFFHCFGCQESGTALGFVMQFDRLEFPEAVEVLARDLGLEVPREDGGAPQRKVDPTLYDVLERAEKFYRSELRNHPVAIEYLKSRGLTGEVARDFGIGYAPDAWQGLIDALGGLKSQLLVATGMANKSDKGRLYDRFRDRIMFPIRDTRGRVIGFGGRTLGPADGPKYMNSPETEIFHKGEELYGLYEARKALRNIDRLIIVEGYMDVVALAQHGVANAVATLGTASGTQHFQKIYRYTDEVVCCFDGDDAGRAAAWKALENALPVLNEHRQLKFAFLPDGEDPDSLVRTQGRDQFVKIMDNALPGMEFLLQRLAVGLDMESVDGRARFNGLAGPYLDKMADGILKDLLRERIRSMTGYQAARPLNDNQSVRPVAPTPSGAGDKVSERLLTIVLKHPDLWFQVGDEARQAVLGAVNSESTLGKLLDYIDKNSEADTEELLVRFGENQAGSQTLLALAERHLDMSPDLLSGELSDLCSRIVAKTDAVRRKEALQKLKESQNVDELRRYWEEHRNPGG